MMDYPQQKYMRDATYKALVDMMENVIHRADFSPSEIREAAMLACIHFEIYRIHNYRIPLDKTAEQALDALGTFVSGKINKATR